MKGLLGDFEKKMLRRKFLITLLAVAVYIFILWEQSH